MTLICRFLLLLFVAYCSAIDRIEYYGLRLDMSALTLNRDIIGNIIPGLNRTLLATFPHIEESGSFLTKLIIRNLRITYYKVNEERFDMNSYEFSGTTYKLKGAFEAVYFHIAFTYEETFIGIPISSGSGQAAVTNLNRTILVFFNESDPDVQIPHPWDVVNITLSSTFFGPTSWVKTALHAGFVPHFHKAVDDSMYDFAHNLLKTYRRIEDIFPHDIDLIFGNDIYSVTPTVGGTYLTIAFKTNITVNGYVHKKMHRRMLGHVYPMGDFDYCMAAQLVPDVFDALSKGGYYDSIVPASFFGFETSHIREFFKLIPSLQERYKGDEEVAISCSSSRFEASNDLTQRGWGVSVLQMQNPLYCFFYTAEGGDNIMIVDIYMRFYYDLICKDEGFYGKIHLSELYGFNVIPDLTGARKQILETHVKNFTHTFSDTEMLSPGVRVIPNRHNELSFYSSYTMSDEICFYYKEKRPIMQNQEHSS